MPWSYEEAASAPPRHLFDKDQWREVARRVRPDLDDDEFDELWNDYHAGKAHHD
jgi:hypothetical protein